jgi:hypothetical protein
MRRDTGILLIAVTVLASAPLRAGQDQPWTPPRTPDGHPDLQGVWANNAATPLERPQAWEGKTTLSDAEVQALEAAAEEATDGVDDALFGDQLVQAAIAKTKASSYDPTTGNYNKFWIVDRDFENRTSLVIDPPDGRLPPLAPEAAERQQVRREYLERHPADSWEDRNLGERCISFGVPRLGAGYNSYYQIFQTPDHVAILMETIHDARIIPLDGRPHLGDGIRQWNGDSRGRWEGDTLVIETTNYSSRSDVQGATERLRVVERLTRSGPDTLDYQVTMDDPATWTKPWTALIRMKKTDDAVYEYACHEGNYGMTGILSGHRAEEKAARERTGQVAAPASDSRCLRRPPGAGRRRGSYC